MRFNEFNTLSEGNNLDWSEFNKAKRAGRYEANLKAFLEKMAAGSPFLTITGSLFLVDNTPKNINAIKTWEGGTAPFVTGTEGDSNIKTQIQVNKLAKTTRFGGELAIDPADEGTVQMKKQGYLGRPSDIDLHNITKDEESKILSTEEGFLELISNKGIPGSKLTDLIIKNPVLNSKDLEPYGQYIIDIAKSIKQGQYPVKVPAGVFEATKLRNFIQDYPGEYLGVAGLINGLGDFPKLDGFLEFLGAKDLRSLNYYFPMKSNMALADSFAFIQAPGGDHKMRISSKGAKGAAPSLQALKIPDGMRLRNDTNKGRSATFLSIINNNNSYEGPIKAINYLATVNKPAIAKLFPEMAKTLPLTQKETDFIINNVQYELSGRIKLTVKDLPSKRLQNYVKSLKDVQKITGKLLYVYAYNMASGIDEILPGFQSFAKELLGYNFVQIFTDIKGKKGQDGNMYFRILWPAKIDGTVSLAVGGGQGEVKGRMSFRIH